MAEEKKYFGGKTPDQLKFEGKELRLGGEWYVIPALSLKQIRTQFTADLNKLEQGGINGMEALESITKMVFAAMVRNYPELKEKREEIEDYIDLGNMADCTAAILGPMGETIPFQRKHLEAAAADAPG